MRLSLICDEVNDQDKWEGELIFLGEKLISGIIRLLNEAVTRLETPFVLWLGKVATVHLTKLEDIEVRP